MDPRMRIAAGFAEGERRAKEENLRPTGWKPPEPPDTTQMMGRDAAMEIAFHQGLVAGWHANRRG